MFRRPRNWQFVLLDCDFDQYGMGRLFTYLISIVLVSFTWLFMQHGIQYKLLLYDAVIGLGQSHVESIYFHIDRLCCHIEWLHIIKQLLTSEPFNIAWLHIIKQLLTSDTFNMMWYWPVECHIDIGYRLGQYDMLRSISHHIEWLTSQ